MKVTNEIREDYAQSASFLLLPSLSHRVLIFFLFLQGAVITPAMDHTMSMQPASMMGPLTQQMNHLSLGTTGSVSTPHCASMNHTQSLAQATL